MQPAISADSHLDLRALTENIFVEAAPSVLKTRVPFLTEGADGRRWTYPGRTAAQPPQNRAAAEGKNYDRMRATDFYKDAAAGRPHPSDVELRLRDQDLDGLVAEVIYGPLGLDNGLREDPEALSFCYRLYQDWAAEFAGKAPDRLFPLVPVSGVPEAAVEEAQRAAELGIRGIELKPRVAVKPFWHPIWESLWDAVEDTSLVMHFHSDIMLIQPKGTPEDREAHRMVNQALIGSIGKMANAEYLGSIILSGVLERHPGIILVMGESDISWLPHYVDRMDYMVNEREYHTGLQLSPSEYWRRQCRATFQNEKLAAIAIEQLGVDNVMWASDYPHPDGTWPASQQVIEERLGRLSPSDRHKVVFGNAAELYGIKQPAMAV